MFSGDGMVTNNLLHPASAVEREYCAVVAGEVSYQALRQTLANGVRTSDGVFKASLLYSKVLSEVSNCTIQSYLLLRSLTSG